MQTRRRTLQWRVLGIVGVVVAALATVYPVEDKVRLGLDLRGGVHLVLGVRTDEALMVDTDARRLRDEADIQGIALSSVGAVSPTEMRIEGVPAG